MITNASWWIKQLHVLCENYRIDVNVSSFIAMYVDRIYSNWLYLLLVSCVYIALAKSHMTSLTQFEE